VVLATTATATAGNQKYSPRLRLRGSGWKTDATAAAQAADWIIENQPVQGSASPTGKMMFSFSANDGAYTNKMYLDSSNGKLQLSNSGAAPTGNEYVSGDFGYGTVSGANGVNLYVGGGLGWFVSSIGCVSNSGPIGYKTGGGVGGAVTQGTSRTTGVTLDKATGAITLVSAAGSASWKTFRLTNNKIAAVDTVIVNQKSGTDLNMIHVTAVGAGYCDITFATTGGTTTEQPVFNFAVIKGAVD
jgi:hypothetical protein